MQMSQHTKLKGVTLPGTYKESNVNASVPFLAHWPPTGSIYSAVLTYLVTAPVGLA